MSAMKDTLIRTCEELEQAGVGEFDQLMAGMLDAIPTGYVCKRCSGPSPVGVGYADDEEPHTLADDVLSCPCGYSRKPVIDAFRFAVVNIPVTHVYSVHATHGEALRASAAIELSFVYELSDAEAQQMMEASL